MSVGQCGFSLVIIFLGLSVTPSSVPLSPPLLFSFLLSSFLTLPVTPLHSAGSQWLLLRSKCVCAQLHQFQHRDQLRYSTVTKQQYSSFHICCVLNLPLAVIMSAELTLMTHIFFCVLICCALVFCWLFRCFGVLPDLQQAHEQSVPAGNVTSISSYVYLKYLIAGFWLSVGCIALCAVISQHK